MRLVRASDAVTIRRLADAAEQEVVPSDLADQGRIARDGQPVVGERELTLEVVEKLEPDRGGRRSGRVGVPQAEVAYVIRPGVPREGLPLACEEGLIGG